MAGHSEEVAGLEVEVWSHKHSLGGTLGHRQKQRRGLLGREERRTWGGTLNGMEV